MHTITLGIGTTSSHKITAIREAFSRVGFSINFESCGASSSVNEQPIGFSEAHRGATNRAESARARFPDADLWVGIESSLLRATGVNIDFAAIVLLLTDGSQVCSTSAGIMFPEELVNQAEVIGFRTTTVGSIIAKELGGDGTDPHSTLTEGRISRTEILIDAIVTAIKQVDRRYLEP